MKTELKLYLVKRYTQEIGFCHYETLIPEYDINTLLRFARSYYFSSGKDNLLQNTINNKRNLFFKVLHRFGHAGTRRLASSTEIAIYIDTRTAYFD